MSRLTAYNWVRMWSVSSKKRGVHGRTVRTKHDETRQLVKYVLSRLQIYNNTPSQNLIYNKSRMNYSL